MDTDYDEIAGRHKRAKLQPWRTHVERHTLLKLAGGVAGKAAIDLACGEGSAGTRSRRRSPGTRRRGTGSPAA